MNPWTNFWIIISVQLVVFLLLAYQKKALRNITFRILVRCIIGGIGFGVLFDLIVGKYFGVFNYILHFDAFFLIMNGAFSYGLWLLTVRLLKSEGFLPFLSTVVFIGLIYEIANYFYPVWYWTFGQGFLYREMVVVLFAYCGLALLTAFGATLTTKTTFRIFGK